MQRRLINSKEHEELKDADVEQRMNGTSPRPSDHSDDGDAPVSEVKDRLIKQDAKQSAQVRAKGAAAPEKRTDSVTSSFVNKLQAKLGDSACQFLDKNGLLSKLQAQDVRARDLEAKGKAS